MAVGGRDLLAGTGSTVECSEEADTCSMLAEEDVEPEEEGSALVFPLLGRGRLGIHLRMGFSVAPVLEGFVEVELG